MTPSTCTRVTMPVKRLRADALASGKASAQQRKQVGAADDLPAVLALAQLELAGLAPTAHGVVAHAEQGRRLLDRELAHRPSHPHPRLQTHTLAASAEQRRRPSAWKNRRVPVDPNSPAFARQRVLAGFGGAAQQRLAEAHVLVVGAGGLGSTVLPVLAAAGVGTITIVDSDTVAVSNLHRQTLHLPADVGRGKARSAAGRLAALSPDTELRIVETRFEAGTTFDLLLDVDVLVDATDNPATRYLANDAAAIRGIPLVWGSALAYAGQAGVAWDERGVDYRDLFPEDGDAAEGDTCEVVGVLPSVCAVIGGMMATEVLKLLTGVGEPLLGRVAAYDALTGRTREIEYRRDPDAPRPGSLEERTADRMDTAGRTITPEELRDELAGGAPPVLLDVREPWEAAIAAIPGSILVPLGDLPARVTELDSDADLVVYCHHGVRSARALEFLERSGFEHARHLTGGVDAWAAKVDPTLERY
jgi:sulfur-carrier protein adenylyltransferase/sulfurtransferase